MPEFEEVIATARADKRGRKPLNSYREIINAVYYRLRTGCQWRNLPHDFPRWERIYRLYRRWILNGFWEIIHNALARKTREKHGRDPEPSLVIIDSQSVKADAWAEDTGYDAGKKIKGIKRHIIVDVCGLLMGTFVHSASIQDRDGAKTLILRYKGRLPRVKMLTGDGGYRGKLIQWVKDETAWSLEIVKRNDDLSTFKVLPKRWIVERTFAWLSGWRIFNRHPERKHDTAENMMRIAMTKNMLRYLTRKEVKKG